MFTKRRLLVFMILNAKMQKPLNMIQKRIAVEASELPLVKFSRGQGNGIAKSCAAF